MPFSHRIRPLGPLRWIFGKIPSSEPWSVIGALSAEDRCLAAAQEVAQLRSGADCTMLHIQPEQRATNTVLAETLQKIEMNLAKAHTGTLRPHIKEAGNLLCSEHDVINLAYELAESCHPNVVLDITTMPKRFFFPLLTALSESDRIKNLIATNTAPVRYGKVLAEDADEWKPLPMFDGDVLDVPSEATLIIGVGYQPLNVKDLLERNRSLRVAIKLMFPFPSLHPGFIQNWKFVSHIKSEWGDGQRVGQSSPIEIVRVPAHDVSLAFDRLLQHSMEGKTQTLFLAPFGPKSISLAMCLLGIARNRSGLATEIGYTQPSVYMPDYTTGVADRDGFPDVTAYCLRLNGHDFYRID